MMKNRDHKFDRTIFLVVSRFSVYIIEIILLVIVNMQITLFNTLITSKDNKIGAVLLRTQVQGYNITSIEEIA